MKAVIMDLCDVDASQHNSEGLFHYFDLISSEYLDRGFILVSSDRKLYGSSLSIYKSMLNRNIKSCWAVVIEGDYDPKFDLYLTNINSNYTLLYHNVKKKYNNSSDVKACEFDNNQLDLMYLTDLDDDITLDVRELAEETVKIKKVFNITIVLKTLEQNFAVQKFFKTNKNIIDYNYFNKVINNIENPLISLIDEDRDDRFYTTNTYSEFIIQSSSIDELNEVLNFFKINKDSMKTTRINFKRIEKIFS